MAKTALSTSLLWLVPFTRTLNARPFMEPILPGSSIYRITPGSWFLAWWDEVNG